MASGQVTYVSGMMFPHREIYNKGAAQTWPMKIESGSFPQGKPIRVVRAIVKFDIRNVYRGGNRHMLITRENGVQLGDVPTNTAGVQEQALLTSPDYRGITSIKTDGVESWACQLRGGSYIRIVVYWEDAQPVQSNIAKEPVIITGIETTGEKGYALHSDVAVSFDGVDISQPINKDLISLSYTDNEEDEADDLQIKLQDRAKKWLGQWLNDTMQAAAYGVKSGTKGLTISAGVKQSKPNGKMYKADFGFFELDQLKASGPPSNILIKGTSLPYSNGIRTEERDKSWEGYSLKGIGQEIASNGGLGFLYDCPDDPAYSRVEQAKQTDIAFLQQLCHDNGKSLKISGLKLIIFDQARYESMKAISTIQWLDGTYTKYDLSTQDGDTHYDQCTVIYYDAANGTKYEATANADDYDAEAKEHTVCTVTNRKVSSAAEAAELAAKILRLHNKYEKTCSFTMIGNPMLGAGLTIELKGFGLWDEKYIIKQCKHDISSSGGYTTKITLRTIPEGKVTVVKVEEEKDKSGGSGNTQKRTQTKKSWYTDAIVQVYDNRDGTNNTNHTAMMASDVKVELLSNTSGEYTKVQYGSIQGWVKTDQLVKKEDKKTDKKKDKK